MILTLDIGSPLFSNLSRYVYFEIEKPMHEFIKKEYNGDFKYIWTQPNELTPEYAEITFNNDVDYTWFVLRWS